MSRQMMSWMSMVDAYVDALVCADARSLLLRLLICSGYSRTPVRFKRHYWREYEIQQLLFLLRLTRLFSIEDPAATWSRCTRAMVWRGREGGDRCA